MRYYLALVGAVTCALLLAGAAAGDGPIRAAFKTPAGEVDVGAGPNNLQIADFNGDGKQDFLVSTYDNTIQAFLGNGKGGFTAQGTPTATRAFPNAFVGNVNGDKFPDVVVVDDVNYDDTDGNLPAGIEVFLNDGHGNFTKHGSTITTTPAPSRVVFGQFNPGTGSGKDNFTDIAVVNSFPSHLRVLLGDGQGGFTQSQDVNPDGTTSSGASYLAAADFNGDGKTDLAVGNYWDLDITQEDVQLWYSNGDGTFTAAAHTLPLPSKYPADLVAGDVNGDKLVDLVVPVYSGGIETFLQQKDHSFAPAILSPASTYYTVSLVDVNGDKKLDLYATDSNNFDKYAAILIGDGKGHFLPSPVEYPTSSQDSPGAYWGETGDLNGDKKPDYLVTNSSLTTVGVLLWSSTLPTAPVVKSIDHATALIGATVTLTGTNLNHVAAVGFGGVYGTITDQPAGGLTLKVTVPAGAQAGKLSIVTDKGLATTAVSFAPIDVPVVSAFAPAGGQKPGRVVTITGSHFTGVDTVTIDGGKPLTGLKVTDAKITATLPLDAPEGAYTDLAIHNAAATTNATYAIETAAPQITSFTPGDGPANTQVQQVVTIHGNHLFGITTVLFNGKAGTVISPGTGSTVTAKAPIGAKSGKLTVKNTLGTVLTATQFIVDAPPTITGFSVLTGKEGDAVTITGTHLDKATAVLFGGVEQDTLTPASDGTSIATTVPTGAQIGHVEVDTPNGNVTSTQTFTPSLVPEIDSISPATQALKGAALTITGANFTTANAVTIGGATATFHVDSDTQISTTVPAGSAGGSVQVVVTDPGGSGQTSYTILVPAVITSFPSAQFTGHTISVVGDYFDGVSKVEINGENAGFSFVDSQHLTVTVPFDGTTGAIAITNPAGKTTSSTQFAPIYIASLNFSQTNLAPGDTITVSGHGLGGLTAMTLTGAAGPISPNPGGTDTQVVFTMPACGQSGQWSLQAGSFTYDGGTLTYTGPACS